MSDSASGPEAVSIDVSPEDVIAYERERITRLERMARVAPVRASMPEGWKPPKLNPDGSVQGTSEGEDS